jgi:hypothetical protein
MNNMQKNMTNIYTPPTFNISERSQKQMKNMHLKTGLPPTGRPVLRFG